MNTYFRSPDSSEQKVKKKRHSSSSFDLLDGLKEVHDIVYLSYCKIFLFMNVNTRDATMECMEPCEFQHDSEVNLRDNRFQESNDDECSHLVTHQSLGRPHITIC